MQVQSFIHPRPFSFLLQVLSSQEPVDVDDIVESDIDLDDSDLVEPDNDPPLKVLCAHLIYVSLYLLCNSTNIYTSYH
ncbi:hypothetical protein Ahy_A03g010724 isoform E [Arachis hypogaea]|uniref:Uncharacterized protein n=1 Tax=Arachis hypogaea TaxID=3818 RepID=A0A445DND5_ARAHY|nr:hypothetical protein Ahy_A03g010724 isoform E [Arachis hypogaea]